MNKHLLRSWLEQTQFRYKLCLLPERLRAREQSIRAWNKLLESKHCSIHPTTTYSGDPNFFDRIQIGDQCIIEQHVTIWLSTNDGANARLSIGNESFIGRNCQIAVFQPLVLGSYVQIAAYCYLVGANHGFARRDVPIKNQPLEGKPIYIEDDAWVGAHVVVLPGVTIGKGAIIGAGSVVNCNVPPYEIWGGTPARFLKHRPE